MEMLEPADLGDRVRAGFRHAFGREATVVGRAPGRVNLVGEHTDYHGGQCLPIALEHATWAAVAPREDDLVRVSSGNLGEVWAGRWDDRPTGWAAYVVGALRAAGHHDGTDVHVEGTLPLGAGLSSSAALICAVAVAVSDDPPDALLPQCIQAEAVEVGAPTGGLDQSVALLASPGHALLLDFSDGSRRHVPWHPGAAGLEVLVIDTRTSHEHVDGGYGRRRSEAEEAMRLPVERLTGLQARRRRHVATENARVAEVVSALGRDDWSAVGNAFTASHVSLRDDYEVSCAELDTVVESALGAGAAGARLTGGGFGGCVVVLSPVDRRDAVLDAVDAAFADRCWIAPRVLPARASRAAVRLPAHADRQPGKA